MKHLTDHGQRGDGGVVRYRPGGHHGVGHGDGSHGVGSLGVGLGGRGVGGRGRGCRNCETTSTIAPPFMRQAHYAPTPSSSQHVVQVEQVVKVQLLQIKINFLQQLHIREEVVCEKNSEMRTQLFHTHFQKYNTTYTHTQKQNNT